MCVCCGSPSVCMCVFGGGVRGWFVFVCVCNCMVVCMYMKVFVCVWNCMVVCVYMKVFVCVHIRLLVCVFSGAISPKTLCIIRAHIGGHHAGSFT